MMVHTNPEFHPFPTTFYSLFNNRNLQQISPEFWFAEKLSMWTMSTLKNSSILREMLIRHNFTYAPTSLWKKALESIAGKGENTAKPHFSLRKKALESIAGKGENTAKPHFFPFPTIIVYLFNDRNQHIILGCQAQVTDL